MTNAELRRQWAAFRAARRWFAEYEAGRARAKAERERGERIIRVARGLVDFHEMTEGRMQ
jgi:hypothetical protein